MVGANLPVHTRLTLKVLEATLEPPRHPRPECEVEAARGIMGQADLIGNSLPDLAGHQFDRATAAEIVELHGPLTRVLLPHYGYRVSVAPGQRPRLDAIAG